MKREYVKLKWTGPDKGRRVNGRPLREGGLFEVPARDAGYMLTLPGVEAVDKWALVQSEADAIAVTIAARRAADDLVNDGKPLPMAPDGGVLIVTVDSEQEE